MKIVLISDTHNKHRQVLVPEGDILIHAGDISGGGRIDECVSFLHWFRDLPHKHKIFIAGNHDWAFSNFPFKMKELLPNNIIYLENSGIEIEGLKIWGSPVQPTFYNWAFNVDRGEPIKKYWDIIPYDTDVLITHGPPFMIGDYVEGGSRQTKFNTSDYVGCVDLKNRVKELGNLKLHVFGHIHSGYGVYQEGTTTFVNASQLNEDYQVANKPITIEL